MLRIYFQEARSRVVDFLSSKGLSNRIEKNGYVILPGFCDVHVHLREPGYSYKETIATGTLAAAHGGFTTVCAMPNLDPVPDSVSHLEVETDLIRKDAVIHVLPYGAVTVGEQGETLSDLEGLAPRVVAFSDDGKGIQRAEIMEEAMIRAKKLGKIIAAHCEVNELLRGGYIHDGQYAARYLHKGICSESEYLQVERDLALAKKTGAAYHVCHVSTKESVAMIRQAKREGVDVTCETAPHYLLMCDTEIDESGAFKMNPPIRAAEDRAALIEGVLDGTVDMIATDHAPHSFEEKTRGLENSLMGVSGLEIAFSLLYTGLVKNGTIPLEKLLKLIALNPRKRFGIEPDDNFTVFDLESSYRIDPEKFLSKGKSTPFYGRTVYGVCRLTVCDGRIVYQDL